MYVSTEAASIRSRSINLLSKKGLLELDNKSIFNKLISVKVDLSASNFVSKSSPVEVAYEMVASSLSAMSGIENELLKCFLYSSWVYAKRSSSLKKYSSSQKEKEAKYSTPQFSNKFSLNGEFVVADEKLVFVCIGKRISFTFGSVSIDDEEVFFKLTVG